MDRIGSAARSYHPNLKPTSEWIYSKINPEDHEEKSKINFA
jgi:hypothetical protein